MPQRGTAALAVSRVRRVICGFFVMVIFPSQGFVAAPQARWMKPLGGVQGPVGPDDLAVVVVGRRRPVRTRRGTSDGRAPRAAARPSRRARLPGRCRGL